MAELVPCGMVTTAGTFTAGGEADSDIAAPPLGAADVRLTVQVDVAEAVIVTGLHEKPYRPG